MDKVVAGVLLSEKRFSNLPDKIALNIQKLLGVPLATHYNNNINVRITNVSRAPDMKFILLSSPAIEPLKSQVLCRYGNQLFALLTDYDEQYKTIDVYDISNYSPKGLSQWASNQFLTCNNTGIPHDEFQNIVDQYTHESLPRQVVVWPIVLQTKPKYNMLPKHGPREKWKTRSEACDKKSLEKTIAWIIKQQQSIQKYNNSQYI